MIQYFQQLPDIIYGISRQIKMSKLKNETKLEYLCLSLHLEIYIGLKSIYHDEQVHVLGKGKKNPQILHT